MKKWLKIVSFGLTLLTAIIALVIVVFYISLKNPRMTEKFIPQLERIFQERYQLETHIGSFSFDVLTHLKLANTQIKKIEDHGNRFLLKAESMEIQYSLWEFLLNRNLQISRLSVDNGQIDINVNHSATSPQDTEDNLTKPLDYSALIEDFFTQPKALVYLEQFDLTRFAVIIHYQDKAKKIASHFDPVNFHSYLDLGLRQFNLSYQLDAHNLEGRVITGFLQNNSQTIDISTSLSLHTKGKVKIESDLHDWHFHLEEFGENLSLDNVEVTIVDGEEKKIARANHIGFETNLSAFSDEAGPPVDFFHKTLLPLKLDGRNVTYLGGVEVSLQDTAKNKKTLRWDALSMFLNWNSQISSFDDLFNQLVANFHGKTKLKKFQFTPSQENQMSIAFPSNKVEFSGELARRKLETEIDMKFKDWQHPFFKQPMSFKGRLKTNHDDILANFKRKGWVSAEANAELDPLHVPSFKHPVAAKAALKFNAVLQERDYGILGDVFINNQRIFNYNSSIKDEHRQLRMLGECNAYLHPDIYELLEDRPTELTVGSVNANNQFSLTIRHPLPTIEDISQVETKDIELKAEVKSQVEQTNPPLTQSMATFLYQPLTIHQQIQLAKKKIQFHVGLESPDLEIAQKIRIRDFSLQADVKDISMEHSYPFTSKLHLNLGYLNIFPIKNFSQWHKLIRNLKINADISRDRHDNFVMSDFELNSGNGALHLSAFGQGNPQHKKALVNTDLNLNLTQLQGLPQLTASQGEMRILSDMTLVNGDDLSLNNAIHFHSATIGFKDIRVSAINGRMGFAHDLKILDQQKLGFAYLIDKDPFQKVDFQKVSPYLIDDNDISIKAVTIGDKAFGPFTAHVSQQQNMLFIPRFALQVYDGNLEGELHFDFHPQHLHLGFKSMLTHFNPSFLLKPNERSSAKSGQVGYLNLSSAFEVDLIRSLMEGQIDVTQLNADQLQVILDIFDPQYEEERFSPLRQALNYAHPEHVTVSMKYGLMDLKVQLNTMGVLTQEKVTSIEWSKWMSPYTAKIKSVIKKFPLQ